MLDKDVVGLLDCAVFGMVLFIPILDLYGFRTVAGSDNLAFQVLREIYRSSGLRVFKLKMRLLKMQTTNAKFNY